MKLTHALVFDVESIGLHGEAFAVGGCILNLETGDKHLHFLLSVDRGMAQGAESDLKWVNANIPRIEINRENSRELRDHFWSNWERAKAAYPGIVMAAECGWPVEANFLESCIKDDEDARRFSGPYPLHEIASFMQAAGMEPMATYERNPDELPAHDPMRDAMQSARLMFEALGKINTLERALSKELGIKLPR